MRIFITGDTHGLEHEYDLFSSIFYFTDLGMSKENASKKANELFQNNNRFNTKNFPEGKTLTKEDLVIVCGDFGLLFSNIPTPTEQHNLKWLESKPWTTLFIDGNHENFPRLNSLPIEEKFGGKVGCFSGSIYHLKRGEIYTINGKKFFTLGGAMSQDKEMRIIGQSWWEEELPNYQEIDYAIGNLNQHGNIVDYIITHTCPAEIASIYLAKYGKKHGGNDPMSKYLSHILSIVEFKTWFFGHWHDRWNYGKFQMLNKEIIEIT